MKYCGSTMATAQNHGDSEVDSMLLNSSCWSQAQSSADQYLLEAGCHKLILGSPLSDKLLMESSMHDSETQKMDVFDDDMLLNSQPLSSSLAELKPLPPFTGYTGHLSINGIPGHHYHTIAQRLPEENNNYPHQSGYSEHNIVSSSTCLPDSDKMYADSCMGPDIKLFGSEMSDSCSVRMYADSQKELVGEYDMSSIEDIAAIIGSAIADTTVTSHVEGEEGTGSRDSWMDLDAWIDGACVPQDSKLEPEPEFVLPNSPQSGSTLQSLLTHGYMPLLQNRLQHGPPIKVEAPSSTSYCPDMISTSSPPGSVVSTTDNLMMNGRYLHHHYALTHGHSSMKPDGLCSPDHILGQNYPHTTTNTPMTPKNKRNRSQKKSSNQQMNNNVSYQNAADLGGLLGKEKPVHRCNICNRGFLNKSNIKVHLRTHTGEKPFRCEVCAKAFRQKAHLIKHQQIHKRIGRD